MSRAWQPGDVAVWTDSTGETHRIFREGYGERGDMKARWFGAMCGEAWPEPFDDVRPLVVIDPDDPEAVARLTSILSWALAPSDAAQLAAALREFADPKPPKPDEPTGLGAVVRDAEGTPWVRTENRPNISGHVWASAFSTRRPDRSDHAEWSEINAVEVLSEGVTP